MELSNKELGEYLKTIREQLGYSIYDVNKLCDISPSYISLMENGKRRPSPIILKKLSSIYCLDYNDLYKKAGYDELVETVNLDKNTNTDFRYASYNGIDTEGLDDNEIEEVNRFVEFIRNKKKNEKK